MNRIQLRRTLTWTAATILLMMAAIALVVVWTSNQRLWFIDSTGINLTLDMTLSSTGRLIATALLGALIALCLTILVLEFAPARTPRRAGDSIATPERTMTGGNTGQSFSYAPRGTAATPAGAQPAADPTAFRSTVLGEGETRRMEGSLPDSRRGAARDSLQTQPARQRITRPLAPTTNDAGSQVALGGGDRLHSTVPLQSGDRR